MQTPIDPPAPNEIEVSVFGPGYGEAIAIHFGEGYWLLVDSCRGANSDLPATIEYLLRLGVEPQMQVRLVVATHWHDDHIYGLGKVVNACESAIFACSATLGAREFYELVQRSTQTAIAPSSSNVREMQRVYQILSERNAEHNPSKRRYASPLLKRALADRLLFQQSLGTEEALSARIYALSPSDAAVHQALAAFAAIAEDETNAPGYVPALRPNHASVVLWIEIGAHRLLLGADLEVTPYPDTGWLAVFNSQVVRDRAKVFKVAHHGSNNGDHANIWTDFLMDGPLAVVTPYRRGRHILPSSEDKDRLLTRSPYIYLTAPTRAQQRRWKNRVTRELVAGMTRYMSDYHPGWGHVRLRTSIHSMAAPWQVALFGDAHLLSDRHRFHPRSEFQHS